MKGEKYGEGVNVGESGRECGTANRVALGLLLLHLPERGERLGWDEACAMQRRTLARHHMSNTSFTPRPRHHPLCVLPPHLCASQAMFIINLILRKVFKRDLKPYIPNFRKAFDHICIHTGGRAVIDEIERQLRLGDAVVEPSRATLYRYGGWEVWAEV